MNPTDALKKYVESQVSDVFSKHATRSFDQYTVSNIQVDLNTQFQPQGFRVTVEKGDHALTFKTNLHGQEVAFQYKMKW